MLNLRGYSARFSQTADSEGQATIQICGSEVFRETADELFNWRFKWLQTVANDDVNDTDKDVIRIDNITITIVNGTDQLPLLEDDFGEGNIR